ncbi:hypothetical protein AQJ23_27430 [Streptomyces antibioticus]|nr:hypothetical protein [Streptomyces antibioticus]KUN22421.1 hypothetical protein AQJ23_27430 [Streptomyces antibioticus]
MRALVSRGLLVPPLVCAALFFGQAGTAAAVGDVGRAVPGPSIAEAAVRADAGMDTFLDSLMSESLLTDGSRLDPAAVDGMHLDPAMTDGARLDPAAATSYAAEIRAWGATVQERLRGLDTPAHRAVAADPVADLIAQVQAAVSGLLSSLTSLDLGGVLSAVTGLLSPVLDLITGLLGSAVPKLPDLPVA